MRFTKMQGAGNDYIYINCLENGDIENPSETALKLCDRHFAVGADGIVLIKPSAAADFKMDMYNSDGSRAEMCGNAIRCVGRYVVDRGLTSKKKITIETLSGIKTVVVNAESVTVEMNSPILKGPMIPVDSTDAFVVDYPLEVGGDTYRITCVSMGNPHAVIFVEDVDNAKVHSVGRAIEHHKFFPNRTNVEFVQVIDRKTLKMRVWERGTGETMACGTGACASLVAAVLQNKTERSARVELLGGSLDIEWNGQDNLVYMTGPAEFVFEGELLW